MRWQDNDALFFEELKQGHAWQTLPATFLSLQGFQVEIPSLKIRSSIVEASNWKNDIDLYVNGIPLEIKSRNEEFTSPESFPFATTFVDTCAGYDAKEKKPFAYIMVSRPTGAMLALQGNKPTKWIREQRFDRTRRIKDWFYLAPKEQLHPMSRIVTALRSIIEQRGPGICPAPNP